MPKVPIWIDTDTGTWGSAESSSLVIVEIDFGDDEDLDCILEGMSDMEIANYGAKNGVRVEWKKNDSFED